MNVFFFNCNYYATRRERDRSWDMIEKRNPRKITVNSLLKKRINVNSSESGKFREYNSLWSCASSVKTSVWQPPITTMTKIHNIESVHRLKINIAFIDCHVELNTVIALCYWFENAIFSRRFKSTYKRGNYTISAIALLIFKKIKLDFLGKTLNIIA